MAVTVRLPGSLRDAVGGKNKVEARGATVDEVFADIEQRHPGFRERVLDEHGALRTYVNVYVGEEDARAHGGTKAPVKDGSEVMVIPAMAGGAAGPGDVRAGAGTIARSAERETLTLPAAARDEIVAHARAEWPRECCGLVAGRGAAGMRVIRCANAHDAPTTRYRIDPREQLRAIRAMDEASEELVAIYHSHPQSQPYPSPTDRAEAHYPEAFYVLVSLRTGEPELHAYRIASDGFVREAAIV